MYECVCGCVCVYVYVLCVSVYVCVYSLLRGLQKLHGSCLSTAPRMHRGAVMAAH